MEALYWAGGIFGYIVSCAIAYRVFEAIKFSDDNEFTCVFWPIILAFMIGIALPIWLAIEIVKIPSKLAKAVKAPATKQVKVVK